MFRSVGRLAFPIFAYQLVNGFEYTKNRSKHIITLFIFALISEIPFDLFDANVLFSLEYQNVMVTMLMGTLMMCVLEYIEKSDLFLSIENERIRKALRCVLMFLTVVLYATLNFKMRVDYGARGIVLIAILYFLRNDKIKLIQYGPLLFLIDIFLVTLITSRNMHETISYCQFEVYAIGAFLFMYLDNGQRHGGKVLKWTGYAFYPVHLLLIHYAAKLILG